MTSSGFDASTASKTELLEKFCALARQLGYSHRPNGRLIDPRPQAEKEALLSQWREVIGALRQRATLDDVRYLFMSPDEDVRRFAATTLHFYDEELAAAAFSGVAYAIPTQDALALTRRARALNAADPPPDRMTTDQLVERFVDVGTCLYATRFFDWLGDDGNGVSVDDKDCADRNHWLGEEILVLRELKSRGALARLLPFLDDPNPVIQQEAATACLAFAPEKAIAILEHRAMLRFGACAEALEGSYATTALQRWRAGKSVIWGVV